MFHTVGLWFLLMHTACSLCLSGTQQESRFLC
jgi:hypothetical protein